MISLPRAFAIVLAALFSAYHLVLATYSIGTAHSPWPVLLAMVIYAGLTVVSLWPTSPLQMPNWMGALVFGGSIVISILVLSQLDGSQSNGYATWSVAAVGTLLTIATVRQQAAFAWLGIAALAVIVVIWANPLALITTGVTGSAIWVAVAHALTRALARAARDTSFYARAELEAAAWHATHEAQLTEGRHRLDYINRVAGPMLHLIVDTGGELSAEDQRECLHVEGAIRDEIRGRLLLNEEVRAEVFAARRRGIDVSLLDDGGLDDVTDATRTRIQSQLATEISRSQADRLIVRTGADDGAAAVTVVGLRVGDDGSAVALGAEGDGDEVAQWTEIPRALEL
ncbi:hypothetical protein KPL76_06590 [Subtercola sp. PAMC28395]|uniref:hypothetical protein n=1 Tax=Subtercola sp. PAMC28395 TaxID=2846775 RepID=UPI001C0B1CFD|nr:hypothetical protein [Subtercola sp. PAMC28395]QWT25011.1 hypothetical protein KPL76_06590 [Subtercola sp. PAMC28395]